MPRRRRPKDAIQIFLDTIDSIFGLVTPVPVDAPRRYDPSPALLRRPGAWHRPAGAVAWTCPHLAPASAALPPQPGRGGWWAQIGAYQYTLLDQGEQEIVAYHLHPEGPSHVVTPHLHLGAGAQVSRAELGAAHLQTGPIPPTAVIRLAIEAFSAQPSRQQWDVTLREADSALLES